jgi:D-glycero-D-manno-heptose 1,7-bisphosphate phosphatase
LSTAKQARRHAVFLDRDGVLNRTSIKNGKPYAPRQLSDFRLLPGVVCAVNDLKSAGFLVIVVTNQPDLGHGLISQTTLVAMHAKLQSRVPIDDIMVCPHRQEDNCSCRKPRPGLIMEAMKRWGISAAGSYIVGDRWNDIVAGRAAGLYSIFVNRGYAEDPATQPDLTVRSLKAAAIHILER